MTVDQKDDGSLAAEVEQYDRAAAAMNDLQDRIKGSVSWFEHLLPPPEQGGMRPGAFAAHLLSRVRRADGKFRMALLNDPDSFMFAATDCAAKNMEPWEEYWFVPFEDKRHGTGYHITGIPGWKGELQQIYHSGMVRTVKFGLVYNGDEWDWVSTRMETPYWKATAEDRSNANLQRVFAYAEYHGGGISEVVVMERAEVMAHKKASKAPWEFWDGDWEFKMWRKTVFHELYDLVPHSPGWNTHLLKAYQVAMDRYPAIQAHPDSDGGTAAMTGESPAELEDPAAVTIPDAVPGQVVERSAPQPPARPARGGNGGGDDGSDAPFPGDAVPGPVPPAREAEPAGPAPGADDKLSKSTGGKISYLFTQAGWTGDEFRDRRLVVAGILAVAAKGDPPVRLTSPHKMTEVQGRRVEERLGRVVAVAVEAGRDPAEDLQRLYDALMSETARLGEAGQAAAQ